MNPDDDDQGRGRAQGERRPMDVEAVVQSDASSTDEVQLERASRATWRLAETLAPLDPTVAAAALTCVKRALAALPTDHLHPVFPGGDAPGPGGDAFPGLDGDPGIRRTVDAVADELAREYALRKETVARRAGLTVTSFSYSKRLRGTPEVGRDFLRRAGAGGTQAQGRDALPGIGRSPSLADAKRARVADLARCVLRTNAEAHRTLDASVKRVLIGNVPDRGGRTEEARGGGGNMPAFTARVAGGRG